MLSVFSFRRFLINNYKKLQEIVISKASPISTTETAEYQVIPYEPLEYHTNHFNYTLQCHH